MTTAAERALAVRRGVGLFVLPPRGLVVVRGGDARRWLNGMVTNDVAALAPDSAGSACRALALTRQGRIVADLHVIARTSESFWLELAREAVVPLIDHLGKTIIADDVTLDDRSDESARIALEGPRSAALLADALDLVVAVRDVPQGGAIDVRVAGADVVAVAWGESGERAFRLIVPCSALAGVEARLREAGVAHGLVCADAETLDVLRVESGTPRFGAELGPDVLPAEARLDASAISFTKGCYTGQEIVARMRSRGSVGHLLVGLALEGSALPAPRTALSREGQTVGEITSVAQSASAGAIALGFVRRPHDAIGTRLVSETGLAVVHDLPFVTASAGSSS